MIKRWADPYLLSLLATVGVASLVPARGVATHLFDQAMTTAVCLLFFLHGARLAPRTAWGSLRQWRLHLAVFAITFGLFPILGLTLFGIPHDLRTGIVFLCVLPSTVQSSIAFTSIARGNVAASICSASFSNLAGVLVSPALVALLLGSTVHFSGRSLASIAGQLLLPFFAGQLARRWIGGWVARHRRNLTLVDRGSVLLVVYTAFSAGVIAGIWHRLSVSELALIIVVDVSLLGVVLCVTGVTARGLGFSREDRIVLVFCGSKKSLAAGLPMATVMFAGHDVSIIVLPLMLFHQIQLVVCAVLARRYADQPLGDGERDALLPGGGDDLYRQRQPVG
jgi:sodium/bile acid cotransporter 7